MPEVKAGKRRVNQGRAFLQKHLDDVLLGAGWILIVSGVGLFNIAVAMIIGGILFLGIACLIAYGAQR